MGRNIVCDYCKKLLSEDIYTDPTGKIPDAGSADAHNHSCYQISVRALPLKPRLLLDRSSWNTQRYIMLEFCDERCLANWVKEQLSEEPQLGSVPEK